jgi:hypothetical protein
MANVDPPAFIAGMAETVTVMRGLCSAITDAPVRHGNLPSGTLNAAMSDLQAEAKFAARLGEDWLDPVRDTQTFGGMTLTAATDYGQCYAQLFTGGRAPVFGHLVVARAGLEASVISSWLNDPQIETEERIKRGLCELVYSTSEVRRLGIDGENVAANMAPYTRMASALGWGIRDRRGKPEIGGTQRPSIGPSIAEIVLGDRDRDLGRVQWS